MAVTHGSNNMSEMEQILVNSKADTCTCTLFISEDKQTNKQKVFII